MLGALSRTDIVRHASPLLSSTFAGCSDATVTRLAINIVEGNQLWKRPRVQSLCVTFGLFGAFQRASIPVSPDTITSHVVVAAHVARSLTNGNRPATLFCVSPHRVGHSEPVEMVRSGGSAAPDSPRCQMAVVGLGGCGTRGWERSHHASSPCS